MSNPVASVEIQARSSGLAAQLREARAQFGRFADGVKQVMGRAMASMRGKGGLLGKGGTMGNVMTGIGQGVGQRLESQVEDAAHEVIDFDRAITKFGISARKTPEQLNAFRASVRSMSNDTGVSRTEIVKGAQAFVDLAGASAYSDSKMRDIVKTSKATGAEMGDVITVAYSLGDALKIKDTDIQSTMSGLVNQSKDGAVHFNQMASEIIGIAPRFARFGVLGREGAIELGAMFQITRTGFKDAEQTATGLQGVFNGLNQHADRFAEAGVRIFNVSKNGTKTFRPLSQIFADIDKSQLAKDPQLLRKAFGRGEGEQAFHMLQTHIALYKELIKSGEDATTIEKDFQTVMESPSGKLDAAWNRVKLAIADAMTPERIAAFAQAIEDLAAKIEPIVQGVGKIGGVLGTFYNVGKSIRGAISGTKARSLSIEDQYAIAGEDSISSRRTFENIIGHSMSDEEFGHRLAAAKRHKANIATANDVADSIMGAERDDKSTPESIQKAVFAKHSGTIDVSSVGQSYLRAAGVTQEQQDKIVRDAFREGLSPMLVELRSIADSLAQGTQVKVGSEPIVNATKNAPTHRRGVAR